MDERFMVILYNTLYGYLILRDRRTTDEVKDYTHFFSNRMSVIVLYAIIHWYLFSMETYMIL
jgi:hypothetical protein